MRHRLLQRISSGLVGLMISAGTANAQVNAPAPADTGTVLRGPYSIVITAGGGLSYYSSAVGLPSALEQARILRFGNPASLRMMWYPDHRLRVGIETGWLSMYRYRGRIGGDRARVAVSAVPVLLVFSMPLAWLNEMSSDRAERRLTRRLALTAGTGVYLNRSYLNYAGAVRGHSASLGWMVAGSYTYPIGRRFRVAAELKWLDAIAVENALFTAELQVVWRAFSW